MFVGSLADERDRPVPELDEVLGGEPAAGDVVGDDRRHARRPGVSTSTTGTPAVVEPVEIAGRDRERQDQEPVGPVAAGDRRQVLVAVHRGLDVEEHEVVAALVQLRRRRRAAARPPRRG